MTHAEHEAIKLTANTGVEWRPINHNGLHGLYLISAGRSVYSINRHRVLKTRKFKNCPSEYIEMTLDTKKKLYQIDELMLSTFPELFSDTSAEKWKVIEIDGEKTNYEVSDSGKVRRINNHHIVKATLNSAGYLLIRIRHQGKTITEFLHRLVAKAFVPNPYGFNIVNHIDEDKENDRADNLEWCDKSYNLKYSYYRRKTVKE